MNKNPNPGLGIKMPTGFTIKKTAPTTVGPAVAIMAAKEESKVTVPKVESKVTVPTVESKVTVPTVTPEKIMPEKIMPPKITPTPTPKPKAKEEKHAFAIIHFGKNPVYLELELYFFKMLRQYTTNDIIYLYSINDTPESFVDAVRPLVTRVVSYDDKNITYDVSFTSGYSNFNTLRTCNFIFAYTLEEYDKVCVIESDMVIMKPIDSIFRLQSPAVLTYLLGDKNLKLNIPVTNKPADVLEKCREMGRTNGGVMLINPSNAMFEKYKTKIQEVVQHECKYPNETLFEYVNNSYYNLPIQYNLSHFLAKSSNLIKYGLVASDISIYHFNETKFKHIDIIKNPIDEDGKNWIDVMNNDKKYEIKKLPILHYKNTIYDKYYPEISKLMANLEKSKTPDSPRFSPHTPDFPPPKSKSKTPDSPRFSPHSPDFPPPKSKSLTKSLSSKSSSTKSSSKSSSSKSSSSKSSKKKPKCPKGTRRSKKTGNCEPYTPQPRCPKGTQRNKKTGKCEAK